MYEAYIASSPHFGQVRKVLIDEVFHFVAKDVAHALGFSDATTVIQRHCRDAVRHWPVADQLGRLQSFRVLSQADVIRIAAASHLDDPDSFTRWLFDEPEPELGMIPLHEENDQYPVRGRELHSRLKIDTPYTMWMQRMCEYGFEEGKDYLTNLLDRSDGKAGKPLTDHNLTISMAKEICMLQRSEQGRIIRRHLIAVEEAWNSPDAVINRALKISAARVQSLMHNVQQLQQQIALDAPKVAFADSVAASETDIHVGELAKILKQNGFDTGRTRLFELLRRDGYIMKAQSGEGNTPTQKSMNLGLMRVKEVAFPVPGHGTKLKPVIMITGKGQLYFIRHYAHKP